MSACVGGVRLETAASAELREVKLGEARSRRQLSAIIREGCCSNTTPPAAFPRYCRWTREARSSKPPPQSIAAALNQQCLPTT